MSSNAKRNCTEIGSNVELPKNISWAFSCKISKTKAQLPGGTTEAAKNLLLSPNTTCRPIVEWARELNDRRHEKDEEHDVCYALL